MNCQAETEVIAIEDDDDEEDVEVVFSNLDKTYVHRNLIHRKISQEIELLQTMSKHRVPNEFSKFKELAKKLGVKYSDEIIQSAWNRIFKKHLVKSINLLNNITPKIRLVELPQPSIDQFLPQVHSSANISPSVTPLTPPFPPVLSSSPTASVAVPVALILNKSIQNNPKAELTMKPKTFISTPGTTHRDDQNWCSNQLVPEPENNCSKMEAKASGKKKVFSNINKSQNKKRKIDTLRTEEDKPCLLKSGAEKNSDNSQVSSENELLKKYLDSLFPGQTLSSANKKATIPTAKKRKSSSKQVLETNLPNSLAQASPDSHVGVQAKIIRTKRTSPTNSKKRPKTIKEISDEELREFKAEQKRLKNEQKREFEIQQLQKVHDRLVDVLIPKYYKKGPNEKG